MTLGAVLWDMDGLLVDTEPIWTVAEVELAAALGGTWTDEIKAAVVGTRLDVSVPTILRWYEVEPTPARVAETAAWLLHRVAELYSDALPARAGVCELFAALREEGVPMALVSSSFRVLVDEVLAHGYGPFDVTLAGDEVACGKPDPEPYLTAAARLGTDPANCVVLEDSPSGVASGLAAGCFVLAVPSVAGVEFGVGPRLAVAADLCGVDVAAMRDLVGR